MLKAVLALLVAFHWVDNTSTTYQILNFMGDAAFYFLPILLADSAARKFGCNTYLAMMLGGILLSVHNLHYLIDLMRRAREAVLAGAYEEFYEAWMASPAAKDY